MEKLNIFFKDEELYHGRLISFSKSFYRKQFPENQIYFNANVFVLGEGKIWYGDLDLTVDGEKLQRIASQSGRDLYILREMDGRFEGETLSDSEIIEKSVCKITK
jgi:hypothetical protein